MKADISTKFPTVLAVSPTSMIVEPSSPELKKEQIEVLYSRLQYAISVSTSSPTLAVSEQDLFAQNCDFLRRAKVAVELRNFVLLEIFEAKQWRTDWESIEEFAREVAGISDSQLYKSVDAARIMIAMHESGLSHVAPRGRYSEMLVKVPRKHWVGAWLHALEVFRSTKRSEDSAYLALHDYCRDQGIPFGRRRRGSFEDEGPGSSMLIENVKVNECNLTEICSKSEETEDDNSAYLGIISEVVVNRLKRAFARKLPAAVIQSVVLEACGSSHINQDEVVPRMHDLIAFLRSQDPDLATALLDFCLFQGSKSLERLVLERIERNQKKRQYYCRTTNQNSQEEGGAVRSAAQPDDPQQ